MKELVIETNPLTREFYFPGNEVGCLLIHGFTGSPAEMRPLGEVLQEKGYTVLGVRLKGHAETEERMAETGYRDWIKSVEEGYEKLRKKTEKVFVMGLSMGGILALHLARHREVQGVVSLAAPIRVANLLAYLAPVLKYFMKFFPPGKEKEDNTGEKMIADTDRDIKSEYIVSYNRVPVNCVHDLLILMDKTRRGLPFVKVPALVVQSRKDNIVRPVSAEIIYRELGSSDKNLVWLEESGHIITADCEREKVFQEVNEFISSHL